MNGKKMLECFGGILRFLSKRVIHGVALKTSGFKYYIGKGVRISITNKGKINLGTKTWISDRCSLDASGGTIQLGFNNFFNSNVRITALKNIEIGNNNLFGPNVVIVDHDHRFDDPSQLICKQGYKISPIKIGSNIWIGSNVLICRGVSICDKVVIGGNSVVTNSIQEPGVYVGNPLKQIRKL